MTLTTDGRLLRSERTRSAIVDALLALLRAGNDRPSSSEIAAKAGVTQRTLFNQFEDVSAVLHSAVEKQIAHVAEILPEPDRRLPVSKRIERYVHGLERVLDEIAAVRWAVLTHPDAGAELQRGLHLIRSDTRRRLEILLGTRSKARIDAAEAATDPMTWRLLRTQMGLSRSSAAAVMRRTLGALV